MKISILCTILVTVCSVTPEILRVTTASFWTKRQNQPIRLNISAITRPISVSLSTCHMFGDYKTDIIWRILATSKSTTFTRRSGIQKRNEITPCIRMIK